MNLLANSMQFNIIYIMRTNIESGRIRRFMGILGLVVNGI